MVFAVVLRDRLGIPLQCRGSSRKGQELNAEADVSLPSKEITILSQDWKIEVPGFLHCDLPSD
jgi:hypothetical protein